MVLIVNLDVGVVLLTDGQCGHGDSFRLGRGRRLRGEEPARLICGGTCLSVALPGDASRPW
jgi:hypothetical protein